MVVKTILNNLNIFIFLVQLISNGNWIKLHILCNTFQLFHIYIYANYGKQMIKRKRKIEYKLLIDKKELLFWD